MCMNFDSSCTFFIQEKSMLQSTAEQKRRSRCERENYSVAQNLFYIFHPVWKEKPHYMLMLIGESGSEHRDDADGCSSERSCGIESGKREMT